MTQPNHYAGEWDLKRLEQLPNRDLLLSEVANLRGIFADRFGTVSIWVPDPRDEPAAADMDFPHISTDYLIVETDERFINCDRGATCDDDCWVQQAIVPKDSPLAPGWAYEALSDFAPVSDVLEDVDGGPDP